jgi:hypothetical protein
VNIIVVLAEEHPERDAWVDEQARLEAGGDPGPYRGVLRIPPEGTLVHVFGDEAEVAAVRKHWEALQ